MPPNTIEIPLGPDTDTITNGSKSPIISNPKSDIDSSNYYLQIFQASANLLSHVLVGCIVAISLAFAFRNGLPLSATAMHIVLCVIGVSNQYFRYFCGYINFFKGVLNLFLSYS